MNDILYLFNPYSNEGNAAKVWEKLRQAHTFLPEQPVDITQIVELDTYLKKRSPKLVAICGGDGTINRVCSSVSKLKDKPLLTILPLGFGNALAYCLGVETVAKALTVLQKRERRITIDLMKTSIADHDRGVFNISVGFDARIVFNRQNFRYIGLRSYILSAVRSWIMHPEKQITFTIDRTVTLNAKASSLVVANCPVIGQNYIISSDARLDDGYLDCSVFSTKYAYLTNLRFRGFKHPLYNELGKVHFKAKHIRVEGEPYVQIDGDPMVRKEGIEIEILPKAVTFLRNRSDAIEQEYLPFVA
jgi:diacylglycerol kinase family enzyme